MACTRVCVCIRDVPICGLNIGDKEQIHGLIIQFSSMLCNVELPPQTV